MARTNLFTKLKAITGQTPNDFILTIRLKKGALMLRNNPELNITEISDRIGFKFLHAISASASKMSIMSVRWRTARERKTTRKRKRKGAKNRFYMFWTFHASVCTILYTEVEKSTYLWAEIKL